MGKQSDEEEQHVSEWMRGLIIGNWFINLDILIYDFLGQSVEFPQKRGVERIYIPLLARTERLDDSDTVNQQKIS